MSAMPLHIQGLRRIRRHAWTLIALSLVGQFASSMFNPSTQSGAPAQAAPIKEIRR